MKRVLLFGFGLLLLLPFQVRALTGKLAITCNKSTVKPGDVVTCNLGGTADAIVNGIEVKFAITGDASISSFTKTNSKWRDASLNKDGLTVGAYADEPNITGSFDVGKFDLKIADSASSNIVINLTNLKFVDENFSELSDNISGSGITLTLEVPKASSTMPSASTNSATTKPSTPNASSKSATNETPSKPSSKVTEDIKMTLDDILIDNYDIDFSPEVLSYTLEIGDEDTLNILPVNNDSHVSYVIEGNENLRDGSVIYITLRNDDDSNLMVSYALNIVKHKVETVGTNVSDNSNTGRIVLIVIIIILVVINIIRLSLNMKKESKVNSQ